MNGTSGVSGQAYSSIWAAFRHYSSEFVVVVFGALLALLLNEAATDRRDQRRIIDLQNAMNTELAAIASDVQGRMQAAGCIRRRYWQILRVLQRNRPFTIRNAIGTPSFRPSRHGAFGGAPPDQLLRHLGAEDFGAYANIYQFVTAHNEFMWRERDLWLALAPLQGSHRSLSGEQRWQLTQTILAADDLNRRMVNVERNMLREIIGLGIPVTPYGALSGSNGRICAPLIVRYG
jgi:hypothetical protein